MGYLSEPIHGLPCRLEDDNPMAMAEELETVRRMIVNLDHRASSAALPAHHVISESVKTRIHLFIVFPGDQGWKN